MEGSTVETTPEQGICKFFQKDKCRFGDKCNFKHVIDGSSDLEKMLSSNKDDTTTINSAKTDSKSIINTLEEHHSNSSKKPPMKTARDVRQRLQWDDSLNNTNFTIGYLDRFIGIIEKPFSDFSWEDLASVDLTVLAIPEHRIQYFKYRDFKVWDKRQRLDYIFGSTGANKTIYEVMNEVDKAWTDAELTKKECKSIPSTSNVVELTDEDSKSSLCTGYNVVERTDAQNKTTHFICVKVSSAEIVSKLKEFQVYLVQTFPSLENSLVPLEELHITLGTLSLLSVADISACRKTLIQMQEELLQQSDFHLPEVQVKGIGHFSSNIIYASVVPDEKCHELSQLLAMKLLEENIFITTDFVPHITLFKTHSSDDKNIFTKAMSVIEEYKNRYFGMQVLDTFSLCYVGSQRDADGFYRRVCELALKNQI